MLLLTGPLRAAGLRTERPTQRRWVDLDSLPALLSLTLAAALVAFFLLFTSTAVTGAYVQLPEGAPGHEAAEVPAVAGLAAYLVTTGLLLIPLLWWRSRRPARLGAVALLVPAVAWLSVAVEGFDRPLVAGAAGASVAAVLVDLAWTRLDASAEASDSRIWEPVIPAVAGAVAAALIWAGQ